MVKKIFSLALLLMCIFTTNAQQPQNPPMPLNPNVRSGVLPNGLSYYILKNAEPKDRANFYIAQKVGSTLETEDQLGLAHFLEHMAFNGSENFPKKGMLEYLQSKGIRFGADINAYTAFDETVYNINNIPTTDTELMDKVLLMLHDWSCALSLEEEEIDAERGVIQEEWRSRNNAQTRMFTEILPQLYTEYQYTRMPIGTMEVVMNFPYQALRDYYHKWYRPDQQGIVIVGDFDAEVMEKKVVDLFSKIKMPENAAERIYPAVSDNEEPIYVTFEDPELQQPCVNFSIKTEKIPFELRNTLLGYQTTIFENLIAEMINNRLAELSQSPDCPFVNAFVYFGDYWVSKTKGAFNISVTAKNDTKVAFEVAMAEIVRAIKTGFTFNELQRVKDVLIASCEKQYNERDKTNSERLAREIISHFIDNEPCPGIEIEYQFINAILPNIQVEIINQMIGGLITPNNQVMLVYQPKAEGMTLPTKEEMFTILNNALAAEYEAYVDEVITDPLIEKMPKKGKIKKEYAGEFGTTIMELSNGAKVIVKPTDFKGDEIRFSAVSPGGQYAVKNANPSELKIINAAVGSSKLGTFDNIKMSKYLAGKNVNISFLLNKATEEVAGSTTAKDLETLLQLDYLYFTNINPDVETFEATAQQYRSILANADKNPEQIFMNNVFKTWYNNDPLFNQLTIADFDNINYENMLKVAKERLANAADFTFIFVGNVDIDTLRPLVEQYIASLPGKKNECEKIDYKASQAKGQIENMFELEMGTPVTKVFNVFNDNNIVYNIENDVKVGLISDVLGIIFTNTLREEEGGTYSPMTSSSFNNLNNEWTILYMFDTNAESRDKLSKRAYDELMNLLANGANETDFNKVKDAAINQYNITTKENSYWVNGLKQYVLGTDMITGHEEALTNLTLEDFNAFMKTLYNGKNRVQVVMTGVEAK